MTIIVRNGVCQLVKVQTRESGVEDEARVALNVEKTIEAKRNAKMERPIAKGIE